MSANYLKITARRLLRQKTISLINIFGLSVGLAACLLIYLYVDHELSYDKYHPNADRVARLTTTIHSAGSDVATALAPLPAGSPNLLRSFFRKCRSCRPGRRRKLILSSRQGPRFFPPRTFVTPNPPFSPFSALPFSRERRPVHCRRRIPWFFPDPRKRNISATSPHSA